MSDSSTMGYVKLDELLDACGIVATSNVSQADRQMLLQDRLSEINREVDLHANCEYLLEQKAEELTSAEAEVTELKEKLEKLGQENSRLEETIATIANRDEASEDLIEKTTLTVELSKRGLQIADLTEELRSLKHFVERRASKTLEAWIKLRKKSDPSVRG